MPPLAAPTASPLSPRPLALRLILGLALLLVLHLPARAESGSAAKTTPENETLDHPPSPASTDTLLRDARAAESRGDPATALRLYQRADAARPNDPALLQEISKQYSDLSDHVTDAAEKQRLLAAALAAAQRALALDPHSAVNTLSVGICYGKLALLADNRTKVEYSRLIHDYAQRAIALDPDYALAHYVLGRWLYEVAAAGSTKRFFARVLYGGLPPASLADAIRELRRAVELDPDAPANHTDLGLALLAHNDSAAARAEFARALALSPRDQHDADALRRARAALTPAR
jgi:tetratricopeptide (TPR) repeat protein